MIRIGLYDKQDLQGKILIWFNNPTSMPISFMVMSLNIGEAEMDVYKDGLYSPHFNNTFWKTDTDYPNLFLLKEKY
jgi:hypothetical protein